MVTARLFYKTNHYKCDIKNKVTVVINKKIQFSVYTGGYGALSYYSKVTICDSRDELVQIVVSLFDNF